MTRKPRRRANGQGSVYILENGTWKGAFSIGGGKRRSVTARTRRECEAKLQAAMYEHRHGQPVTSQDETVSHYLARWLEDRAKTQVIPRTYGR